MVNTMLQLKVIGLGFLLCFISFFNFKCSSNKSNALHSDTIRVLSFNILYGGDEIDFDKVVEAIQKADPDVVGIQEAEGNIPKLAAALGWKYFDTRLHLLSKHPIISSNATGWYYALIEIKPGRVIAFSNVHLPSDPYGPDLVRAGVALDSVIQNEYATRYYELDKHQKIYDSLNQKGIPLIVTGDFNSPSHRDWMEQAVMTRPHLKYKVDWIVSKRMEKMGFVDTYRAANPDVLTKPGLTWTPASPPIVNENETHDRIDFIWASSIDKVIHSTLVGEEGGKDVEISVKPYPSDHRGVLTTCALKPVPAPAFIQTFPLKDSLLICYHSPNPKDLSIQIYNENGQLTQEIKDVKHTDSAKTIRIAQTGSYHIQLKSNHKIIAENDFLQVIESHKPTLNVFKNEYKVGEAIQVAWKHAPGHRFDWIAIYPEEKSTNSDYYKPEQNTTYLIYAYTYAKESGKLILDKQSKGNGWPLKAGNYKIHLLLDDGYTSLASIPIKITDN